MSSINIDDKVVKKVGDKNDAPLTPDQEAEWMKCALDKYYFFENYVYVQAPSGRMLFQPRPYQRRIIDGCTDNRFIVGLAGRQAGKCICKNTKYKVRNKTTGEIYELTAEEFHNTLKGDIG